MRNLSEKSYLYIEKVEMFNVLHNTAALLMRRRSEWETRNGHQRIFRKVWTLYSYLENVD